MKESITNQVYELRTKAEVTQEELAEAVGVTRQTIIAVEKGNYTPSVLLALKIAKFFSARGARLPDGQGSAFGGKKAVEDIFQINREK